MLSGIPVVFDFLQDLDFALPGAELLGLRGGVDAYAALLSEIAG